MQGIPSLFLTLTILYLWTPALIDDFDANVTSQGDEGYTTPDPDDTGFQGYVTTKWMIGTFIVSDQ